MIAALQARPLIADKAQVIASVCQGITENDSEAVAKAMGEYPFTPLARAERRYTQLEATRVFVRDGFIDRYSGARLVHPAVLRVISKLMPKEFPFHPNWKQDQTHPAYWELAPTVDHIVPVTRGGTDEESNWVTTSMLRNATKSSWTIEELGWPLLEPGNPSEWDGLCGWLVAYAEKEGTKGLDPYVLGWYRALRQVQAGLKAVSVVL